MDVLYVTNRCSITFSVWADDNWLQKHAGETLEKEDEEAGEEETSNKRPADNTADVSKIFFFCMSQLGLWSS